MSIESRRRRRWPLLIAGLLLVALVAIGIMAGRKGDLRTTLLNTLGDERRNDLIALASGLTMPALDTADMTPMRYTGNNPLGINTFLEQEVEISKRRQSLQMIKEAGIGFVRQQFPWQDIERPAKGQYWDENAGKSTWEKYDNIVDLAQQYGLQMIVRLDAPPRWAHPDNEWRSTPPDNYDDYGDFVYDVVSRYKGKVKYYQLWNEPNLSNEWGNKPVDARAYVRLLKIGYQRAKEADPNVVVICAALAPTIQQDWIALSDQLYLQQMYDAGVKGYFDVMSVMAYGLRFGPDDRRLELDDVNFSRPLLIRQIMVRNGDADKPIWASEVGWNVQPESVKAEPVFGRVSEELQARYTVRGLQRAAEEWPWMDVMSIWFFKRADDSEKEQPWYYFRLVDPDFAPKPVYYSVKGYGNGPATIYRGYSQEDHWALTYKGNWSREIDQGASLGQVMATKDAGATISGFFRGTELSLVVPKGPSYPGATVEIDGTPQKANLLRRNDQCQAILAASAAEPVEQQQIAIAHALSDDLHFLEIKANGPFALDGVIVDNRPSVWPSLLPGLAVAVAGMILAIAIVPRLRK